jgi:RNA polymerase sigma-70 factor (ECF subfamily)
MISAVPLSPAGEQLSDAEVVRRVIDGDTALFEILMRRYNQTVYRAVRSILRTDEEVEDVMQQAYLNAFAHLRQFAGLARFSTWLIRIAVNEGIARLRKRNNQAWSWSGGDEMAASLVETKTPDPEQRAAAAQMREVVEAELSSLPANYRTVLVLRDVEGLSTAEAAECLGVSEDVVKTRLSRARAVLREGLARRAGVTLESIYSFGNSRCDRVVEAVMEQLRTGFDRA